MVDDAKVREAIEAEATRLGFTLLGVAPAGPADPEGRLERWLAAGYHGDMAYMERPERQDPRMILPSARSVISLGTPYQAQVDEPPPRPGFGRVARYARGRDYHNVVGKRVKKLRRFIHSLVPGVETYGTVDTGPVLERHWARLAGLGHLGMHGGLVRPREGSWFILAEVITSLDLEPDAPMPGDCGVCGACVEACPTGALVAGGVVDSRRCVAYLTVESRGWIPRELREGVGDMVFGCDRCQEVCPHNQGARVGDQALAEGVNRRDLDLSELLRLEDLRWLVGSPIRRAGVAGLKRNAAVVLGNQRHEPGLEALARALERDPDPMVRGHVAWAMGRIGTRVAKQRLERARAREPDPKVSQEIEVALETLP